MEKRINILLISIFLILSSFRNNENDSLSESPLTGFLNITVESNVNKVLFSYPITDQNLHSGTGRMTDIIVPVKDFKCDNKVAYKDFLTLLKADQFPDLTISIPRRAIQQLRSEKEITLHNVVISIAGVSREYDIACKTEPKSSENISVGMITIGLTDLDITPPVKYFGMVKIKNEVIVKFGLGNKNQSFARK